MLATLITALLVFWLAYDDATFGLVARSSLAIAVWWAIGLSVALGILRLPAARSFWAVAGLLAAFAGWTAASIAWAESNERAFNELNRVSLFLAVFLLAALLAQRVTPSRWADGVALGIVGIALLALGQRFFPDGFPRGEHRTYFGGPQLSYPVEYVNGLAILLALALPLLLRAAVDSRSFLARGAAIAPFPALAAAMYLTSSRGGVLVAIAGILVFSALTTRRWATASAFAAAVAGSAAAIAVLLDRPALVDEPLTQAAEDQGPGAALLIAGLCLATGLVYVLGLRLIGERRPAPALGWVALAAAVALVVAGVAAADPVEKFDEFRALPPNPALQEQGYTVRGHLLSANSTGRWQFWKAATEQFEEHPLVGDGAGSYEAWWAKHGSFAFFIRDAHSLYLETLGELGIVGLALLVAAFALGAAAAIQRSRAASEPKRSGYAALTACFGAFVAAAAIDWMWEFTVVSLIGLAALGWAVGGPTSRGARPLGTRLLVPAVAVLLIVGQMIPLASTLKIRDSQAATRRGDLTEALDDARAARDVQPWAASPYLQLALTFEEADRLVAARRAVGDAIERDRSDWRLWLVQARLQTKTGAIDPAQRSLRQAAMLNPRSPLFARN